jgi:hypothetical protein
MYRATLFIAATAALALTACGPSIDTSNPEYQFGYNDGCDAGVTYDPQFSKRVTRNEDAWKASEMYRAGWKSGFNHCRPPTIGSGGGGDIPGR